MKGRINIAMIAVASVAVLAGATYAADIVEAVQIAPLKTEYTAGDGQIQLFNDQNGLPGEDPPLDPLSILISFEGGGFIENTIGVDPAAFYVNGFLYEDNSQGGTAWGLFNDGLLSFQMQHEGDSYLIGGQVTFLQMYEGSPTDWEIWGRFRITDLVFPPDVVFPANVGWMASFVVLAGPNFPEIDDFSGDFDGVSYVVVLPPIPEPATCLVLGPLGD